MAVEDPEDGGFVIGRGTEEAGSPITPAEIARKYGITQAQYFEWRDQVLGAGLVGLRNGGDEDPRMEQLEDQVKRLQQTVGQLTQEKQILQEALGLGKKRGRK